MTARGVRRRVATSVLALAFITLPPRILHGQPILSREPWALFGCTVTPPEGPGWVQGPRGAQFALLGRKHADPAHTSVGLVTAEWQRAPVPAAESLLAAAHPATRPNDPVAREKITEWSSTLDTTLAPLAVRYRYAFEDRKAPGMKGRRLVCVGNGFILVHPDYPNLVVRCDYSERAPEGAAFDGPEAAEGFFTGVRLARRDVSLESEVEFDGPITVLTAGNDALWLSHRASEGKPDSWELLRLDPVTLAITRRVPVGKEPGWLAPSDDGVWIAGGEGGWVTRVDSAAPGKGLSTTCGSDASRVWVVGANAWVTNNEKGEIWKVDRATGKGTRIKVPGVRWTFGLHARDGLLWVTGGDGQVVALDAVSGEVRGPSVGVASGPRDLAWGADALWVLCWTGRCVQRVDPVARRVVATIPIDGRDPRTIHFHEGSVWVTDGTAGTLTRIDPGTNRVSGAPLHPGLSFGLVPTPGGFWVLETVTGRVGKLALR